MWDILSQPVTQVILSVLVVLILIAIITPLMLKLRDSSKDDGLDASDLLSNFQEMHHEGDISKAEFRSIQQSIDSENRETNIASSDSD